MMSAIGKRWREYISNNLHGWDPLDARLSNIYDAFKWAYNKGIQDATVENSDFTE